MELNFRTLKPSEIDCRVSQIKENGLILLLYKDARCDMNLLDQTVGPMNWTRKHSRDNANCEVSIYDIERGQWVSKEDTGTESNTEAAKGLASDSFKRACVNWGIGRELYTAPFIWISSEKYKSEEGRNGNLRCTDGFSIKDIAYNESREICDLTIVNNRTGKVVYSMAKTDPDTTDPDPKPDPVKAGPDPAKAEAPTCALCGETIKPFRNKGVVVSAEEFVQRTMNKFDKPLCKECVKRINGG